jgi:hypothetical protein
MIWIIGEYADRIDNADELLETFLETFPEETSMVRARRLSLFSVMFHAWCRYQLSWAGSGVGTAVAPLVLHQCLHTTGAYSPP